MEPNHAIAGTSSQCLQEIVPETFQGKSYFVNRLSSARETNLADLGDVLGDGKHIVLGIKPSGTIYLRAGDMLFHGEPGVNASIGRMKHYHHGTVLVFKDLPDSIAHQLESNLTELQKTLVWSKHCYAGVCDQLETVGIHLAEGRAYLPTSLFKKMLTSGFVDANGKSIPYEIYRTDQATIQNLYQNLKNLQTESMIKPPAIIAVVVLSGGTFVTLVVVTTKTISRIYHWAKEKTR